MNVKDLIKELKKLPVDSEIKVMSAEGNSMDDRIDTYWITGFSVVHQWRNIYHLEAN